MSTTSRSLPRPSWSEESLQRLVSYAIEQLAASPVPKLTHTLRKILARLGNQLGIDRTTLATLNPDRQGFRALVTWSAPSIPRLDLTELHASESQLVRRILTGETLVFDRLDPQHLEGRGDQRLLEKNHQKSLLALPLRVSGGTVGVQMLGGVERHFHWPSRFVTAISPLCPALALALERLRIHERLERERQEHLDTQRIAGVGHWRYSFATGTCQASLELYRMLQLDPRTELDPLVMPRRVAPVDRGAFERQVRMLLWGSSSPAIECRMHRNNGEVVWLRCWGEIATRPDGSPEFAHGILHDITARRSAEEAIEATSGRLVRAQEEERTRLGRELHDELGQRIAALTIKVGSLEDKAPRENPDLASPLAQATEELSELGSIVRSLSHSLHPAELRRLGLSRSLASLCRRLSMLTEVDVELDAKPVPETFPEHTALSLYRVAQESMSNAIRHGHPKQVLVELCANEGCVQLRISDDGAGFVPTAQAGDAGLGLLGMQERMRLVRGTLQIHSEEGIGTIIEATVPLDLSTDEPENEDRR